ncbi:MAG: hypothetical protein F6K26_10035 [Moorea sp. SIO2I5]|nr:hypothetical protein [Moorena sp. SIO2I5]
MTLSQSFAAERLNGIFLWNRFANAINLDGFPSTLAFRPRYANNHQPF